MKVAHFVVVIDTAAGNQVKRSHSRRALPKNENFTMAEPKRVSSNLELISRIISGDGSSVPTLLCRYHEPILRHLRLNAVRPAQAEEVITELWETLLVAPFDKLLAYDPQRCSFLGYLKVLADDVVRRDRQRTKRRRLHSASPCWEDAIDAHVDDPLSLLLDADFITRLLPTLTPRSRPPDSHPRIPGS